MLSHAYTAQAFSMPHHHLKAKGSLWEWERQAEPTFQGQQREWSATVLLMGQSAVIQPNSIPPHCSTILCLGISCWAFGCFYTLATVNNEAINMYEHILVHFVNILLNTCFHSSWVIYLGIPLQGHVILGLNFWGTAKRSSKVAAPTYISFSNVLWAPISLHSRQDLVSILLLLLFF